ncbi:MAG: adenylate kinase [Acidimicrobiales bacterium]|jgi:adenylate kinase|nr:adenylate kinase [Acidimicrobiales bacterium]
MRIVLLGAPGSGKGTQGEALARHFGVPHVSSGELFRDHIARGTDLGRLVAGYVRRGDLVPDDLVVSIVGDAVMRAAKDGGYVLDGFPRTLPQAERAFELARPAGLTADAAVYLAVPDDVARERLLARGGEGRVDDADRDVIERRLQVFHEETEPLLDFYRDRGILTTVDATPPPDEVTKAMLAAVSGRA